ncbi:hypothetical protein Drorol1_Dr00013277 [Drosera rotundifolia]
MVNLTSSSSLEELGFAWISFVEQEIFLGNFPDLYINLNLAVLDLVCRSIVRVKHELRPCTYTYITSRSLNERFCDRTIFTCTSPCSVPEPKQLPSSKSVPPLFPLPLSHTLTQDTDTHSSPQSPPPSPPAHTTSLSTSMLPLSSSPDHHHHHHHALKKQPKQLACSDHHHHPHHPAVSSISCLIVSVLLLQSLLLLFYHHLPFSLSHHGHHLSPSSSPSNTTAAADDQCPFGSIFIYDLPSAFNVDLANDCHNLNPWNSRCHSLSNHGFGPSANAALSGTLPAELSRLWYWTDQFSSELIFHRRILRHRCRTLDAASATAFYIPFYAGLAVGRYLWADHQGSVADRDRDCDQMLRWIRGHSDQFNRSRGWDHFMTMGRITWDFRRSKENEWGSRCIYSHGMENVTRLLIERNPWDYFDIGVPYPTGFHPERDADVIRWQDFVRSRKRKTLFCFAGASRGVIKNDFRGTLLSQCRDGLGACRVVDCAGNRCANGTSEVLETFLDSRFCLQPRGDSFTRRSIFDCMVAGAIPVFFWRRTAYLQYEWFLPGEPESYSVFIHRDRVKNGTSIKEVLEGYSDEKVKAMREKVIEHIPRLVYANPDMGLDGIRDAFNIAIDGVLKRMIKHKEMGYRFD